MAEGIRTSIPELYIVGEPPASVIAFGSSHPDVDIMEVGDIMGKRGWHLNALMDPKAVHIACTVRMSCPLIFWPS
jgi:sphinganine-1-phosphate aldolase